MAVYNITSENSVIGSEYAEYQSDEEVAKVFLFSSYSEMLLQFASACCVIFMLIGIPGNLTTIVALGRCKKVSVWLFICTHLYIDFLICRSFMQILLHINI